MAEDLSIETVIIVGCICGFVVVFLLVVLVVLCLHRLRAFRQCERFDKLNVHTAAGMDSSSDLRVAESLSSPAGGVDNAGVDARPSETTWTGSTNRCAVFTTPSSAKLQVYNNGAVHLNYKPNSIHTKHHRPPPPPPQHHNNQQQQHSSVLHDNQKNDNYEVNRLREHEQLQDKVLMQPVQSHENSSGRTSVMGGRTDFVKPKKVIHEVVV